MKRKRLARFLGVILFAAFLPGLTLAQTPGGVSQRSIRGPGITLELELPPYEIVQDEKGFDIVQVEGFSPSGLPGDPLLPRKVYNAAVPPGTLLNSLSLEVIDVQVVRLPGPYHLKLASPDLTCEGVEDDVSVHQSSDAPALRTPPADFVRLLPPGQMRKWRFARLEFTPFQYDAASGELSVAKELTVRINYDSSPVPVDEALLTDQVMDDVAKQLLINYNAAQAWYQVTSGQEIQPPDVLRDHNPRRNGNRQRRDEQFDAHNQGQDEPGVVYDYVIITTNAIEAGSSKLANFIAHKQGQGYSVLAITEDEYGGLVGQPPNGTAEKIRKWLQDNYIAYSIEYVLLIGNPDPDVGDVPMKMCWPRNHQSTYKEAPTDYFFADLTGNWDLDGDQFFGEWQGDMGPGGVDFANEVYVGRIPVYDADYATLDKILQKIMDYENEPGPASWRQSALLPMSFSTTTYDGAPLAEQMMDDYLDAAGFSSWTQYQQGNGACSLDSIYPSDEELRGGTVVRDRWAANDYGLVLWWAHGSATSASVGCSGCWDGNLFSSADAASLDDDHPSFTYQCSCLNGYPENSNNLQYAILKQGGIGTTSATRVSWFNTGVGYGDFDGSTTNSGIGYEYAQRLVAGQAAAKALYNAKASMTPEFDTRLMNFYDFNLYGDPSTGLASTSTGAVLEPEYIHAEGCPCTPQTHELTFINQTGFSDEVIIEYTTSPGATVLEIPSTLGVIPNGGMRPFETVVKIDNGVPPSTTVFINITAYLASNPAIFDTAVIEKHATLDYWEARADSPYISMDNTVTEYAGKTYKVGGYQGGGAVEIYDPTTDSWATGTPEPTPNIEYPVDACFGYNDVGDPVILLLPDTMGSVVGVWHRYNIATDSWDQPPIPAPLPANGIWAHDIIVDRANNLCYITGGATAPGGGNLTTLYVYDPAANAAALLGNFTHIPDGFDFHAGWLAPWIGPAGAVCVGGGVDINTVVYADTQCYDIAAGAFNPPNADLGPLPEPWWAMADMQKEHGNDSQLWLANGADVANGMLQRSAFYSQMAGGFSYGPDPVYGVFRTEGDNQLGNIYVVNGSSVVGFVPSSLHEQLVQCPECACRMEIEKTGPEWSHPGGVATYDIFIKIHTWLARAVTMADVLPPGVTFAGYLSANYGNAWYDAGDNAVYWNNPSTMLAKTAPAPASSLSLDLETPDAPVVQPAEEVANMRDLPPHPVSPGPAAPGDVIENFPNVWDSSTIGLVYNPQSDFVRYAHESRPNPTIYGVDYPVPHNVLHNISLSAVNPGWPPSLDNRNGAGYHYCLDHYFLPDYNGDLAIADDNIVEIDPVGNILNAWETDGAGNDSYDGSFIDRIVDIAVVPCSPTRYFVAAGFDGSTVYEIDLIKAGWWAPNSWGTVMTCTVPGLSDNVGIDYDALNRVLYHSDWNSTNIVVTDLACNVLDAFTCPSPAGFNTGVTFIEGKWPPEVWVTDYTSDSTTRCEAVGQPPPPPVINVTFDVNVTAPISTWVVNTATLGSRVETGSILHIHTTSTGQSVQRALNELGYAYDTFNGADWTGINFSPYDIVIIGMYGGPVDQPSVRKINTDVIGQGKRVIFVGGTAWQNFVLGVDQYLVLNDTSNYSWAVSSQPHFTLVDPAHPLAAGLPASYSFINPSAAYYQLRVTDPLINVVAVNGDGYDSLFYKRYCCGNGDLIWFIDSAYEYYWTNQPDFDVLKQIIANALTYQHVQVWDTHEFHVTTNTPPSISGLPDVFADETTSLPVTIDLWAYAWDAETPDSGLTYTIEGTPPPGAGVTIVGNQWLTINPSTNWCGYTDVTVRVTDPGALWDNDTLRMGVAWSCQG